MGGSSEVATQASVRAALDGASWEPALELLRELRDQRPLAPDELTLLAEAEYGAGRFEAAVTAFEQAHAGHLAAGDLVGAAGAATSVATYLMMDTGLMAPVRGWIQRAERLLAGAEEGPVHAWLAMVQTYERFLSGDVVRARTCAERAIEIGTRHGEDAPVAVARVASARLLILDGHVQDGLALLDEIATVVISGALAPLPAGMVFCELICAMQGLAQYDRAEEWTEAMERWRHGNAFGGFSGRCRVHHAEILRLRGSWAEAEDEAVHACEELRPWMRREYGWPLTELGTIRLRRGDLAGAEEAFLAAHRGGWDPHPGLAELRLAQGDAHGAAALIDDALARPLNLPSKERPPHGQLERAPLLAAQAEIAVAAGSLATAHGAAEELGRIAERFGSRALVASAALAHGRVALADARPHDAVTECEQAVACWCDVGAPYETALARLVLAAALQAIGSHERAELELQAARTTFDEVGAVRDAATAAAACEALVAPAPVPTPAWPVTRGRTVFRCEGDTRLIEYEGRAVMLRDLKGLRYLARLLTAPGREFHVLDLVAADQGHAPSGPTAGDDLRVSRGGDAGPLLDEEAKAAYRRRLQEIEDDIDEANRCGDGERAAAAAADRDYLVAELSRAVGLDGRDRLAGSSSERARTSVTRTLRYAMARIADHHPALADHLERTVATGTFCCYDPDPRAPIRWET